MKLIYATSDFKFKPGDYVTLVKKDSYYVAYPGNCDLHDGQVISLEGVKGNIFLINLVQKQVTAQATIHATSQDAMGTVIKVPTPDISTTFKVEVDDEV